MPVCVYTGAPQTRTPPAYELPVKGHGRRPAPLASPSPPPAQVCVSRYIMVCIYVYISTSTPCASKPPAGAGVCVNLYHGLNICLHINQHLLHLQAPRLRRCVCQFISWSLHMFTYRPAPLAPPSPPPACIYIDRECIYTPYIYTHHDTLRRVSGIGGQACWMGRVFACRNQGFGRGN